jgi:hypothetical protein
MLHRTGAPPAELMEPTLYATVAVHVHQNLKMSMRQIVALTAKDEPRAAVALTETQHHQMRTKQRPSADV